MEQSEGFKKIRSERLKREYDELLILQSRSKCISFEAFGDPPERYIVTYTCTGLYRDTVTKEVRRSNFHQMEIKIPPEYPREKPELRWITPVFNPNIYPSGNICMVDVLTWIPGLGATLAQFIINVGEMVQYKRYNIYNPVNYEAAEWAKKYLHVLPIGRENLIEPDLNGNENSKVNIVVHDFVGIMTVGDSNTVTSDSIHGHKIDEYQKIINMLDEMVSIIKNESISDQAVKQDYELEIKNLKNELLKSKPNPSRIKEMLSFVGDVEGAIGLSTRLAQYVIFLQPVIQKFLEH